MELDQLGPEAQRLVHEIAGYLNFSSGAPDPKFLRAINVLFGRVAEAATPSAGPVWPRLAGGLRSGLESLGNRVEAFRQRDQAEAVLRLVFDEILPAYLRFHRDLLFHQTEATLFQPFFLGRVCEAVLAMGGPWNETERIVSGAIRRLNDFVGYRPIAVLRSAQKMQPYAHEWVRPIPLYIHDAGVAWGRYHDLVGLALEILRSTDEDLLRQAWFHPDLLDELAVDPRAYDFDHPVNRRPNNHFGSWDLHLIDNRGHYRRFVLQQVTLDGLLSRVEQRKNDLPGEELLFEAAAVLACTMLMGSGVTGDGPEAHDSSTTLATLVARIAAYRDAFYERLMGRVSGRHAERLRAEAQTLRQPFGGVRQHLNQSLARRRAQQLQHVHLARLFARMGYFQAAAQQAAIVPVASARMRCEIDCRLTAARHAIDRGSLAEAAALLPQIEDWLHRAIECGAMVDPWNILGFGGQFSRSPAVEDSVHDDRIDELIELLEEIFAGYARLQSKASATGDEALGKQLSEGLRGLAQWWDQFASTEVGEAPGFSGREAWESSTQVAMALGAWHRAGTASGNVAFWREHVEEFRSSKAYALLVDALLDEGDVVAAMALLVHWLSQAEEVPLAEGKYSFHGLILRWMRALWEPSPGASSGPAVRPDPWPTVRRLLDYLEANAESLWHVPRLELAGQAASPDAPDDAEEPLEDDDASSNLFGAAYEDVIYRDTTDDGFEGEMLEGFAQTTDFELARESERISQHLSFLVTVVRLWKMAAIRSIGAGVPAAERDEALAAYAAQASEWRDRLGELLAAVHRYRIPAPRGTHESLVEFDQRRTIKETLLERILATQVETADAAWLIPTLTEREPPGRKGSGWELLSQRVIRALYRGQIEFARGVWPRLRRALAEQPLLYLPLARGGHPQRIAQARTLLQVLRRLLVAMPRRGLIQETGELLTTIQRMERNHPVGPAPVTEFDRLFEIAARGVLRTAIASSPSPPARSRSRQRADAADQKLVEILERPIEVLLKCWLSHSRNVRVSVLDLVAEDDPWSEVRNFIERYGHDLFTQRLLTTYGKLRAILHQGVDAYLRGLEELEEEGGPRLLDDLDGPLPRADAVRWLELCLEAVVENYSEYLDYNSTTTQSDRGEMLYVLLDFLRVEASYERVAWSLKPVLLAHEVLIQAGRGGAAWRWREALAARTAQIANDHLRRFDQLAARYGVRLRTVADRLGQRFVQPLAVDRLCALVRPAMEELRAGGEPRSFAALTRELGKFTAEPGGVGFEVPAWLDALEQEVQKAESGLPDDDEASLAAPPIPQAELPGEELRRQVDSWEHG